MTEYLLSTIDAITQFGLKPDLCLSDKIELLERNLVNVYQIYFEVDYMFDERDYPDFDKFGYPDVRNNIISNFPKFGLYKIANNITNFDNIDDVLTGNAVDDLFDIIIDLLEVKWRIENNSLNDGLWFFNLNLKTHTKQHILDLLNYIVQINNTNS